MDKKLILLCLLFIGLISYGYTGFNTGFAPGNTDMGDYVLPSADGTAGYHLETDGSGTVTWGATGAGSADNLGNHVATTTLNMNSNAISNVLNSITGTGEVVIGPMTNGWIKLTPSFGNGVSITDDSGNDRLSYTDFYDHIYASATVRLWQHDIIGVSTMVATNVIVSSITIDNQYTFPVADGTADYIMKTDGAGTLSWAANAAGATSEAALEAQLTDVTDVYTNNDAILITTDTVTNGATTIATGDQIFDFCETTQRYVGEIDTQYCAVTISTPNALGSVATLISPIRGYAITITTISAQIIGGTNFVFMVEQRTKAGIESAGTDIWSGDVTSLPTNWTGGGTSDFTVPSGSGLVIVPTSTSGDVDRVMLLYEYTRD